jgi:Glycosyltransferase family 87
MDGVLAALRGVVELEGVRWMGWLERPPSSRALVALVGAALAVLVIAVVVSVRPAESIAGSDVTVYALYGTKMVGGAVPYRDFAMEYPPGAAAMFVLPATRAVAGGSTEGASWTPLNAAGRRYYRGFVSVVGLLLGAIVVLSALTLRAMARSARTVVLSLAVVALSPLLIGQVLAERFDVWPAALTSAALAASVRGRYRLGGVMVGLGAAAKIYPIVLLPVLVIVAVRQRGVREAMFVAGAAVGAVAAVLVPFSVASFSGTWRSLRIQFTGGLQIESLASSVLVIASHAADKLSAPVLPPSSDFGTQGAGGGLIRIDLVGPGVGALATVMNVLLAAALCLVWVSLLRSRRDAREDLLRFAAGTLATVLVLGTVLSPQYVVWLIPLVPLVGGRRGTAAILSFVVAAGLTNYWIPDRYFQYQARLAGGPATILLARNLALLALALILLLPDGTLVSRGKPDRVVPPPRPSPQPQPNKTR